MKLEDLTFGQILGAAVVILLLIGIYNTVMTAIKNYLEAKKRNSAPVDELKARVDGHDRTLANDKRHMEEIDDRLDGLKKESSMMLRGVRALLSHEINGNSDDKLAESYKAIDDYLINKG